MDFKKIGEEIIKKAMKYGADEAEAVIENVKEFSVNVRKGEVETLQKSVSKGLGLRVYINKALGFSYTSDLSPESLDETVKRTVDLAKITESKPWQGLPDFGPQPLADLDLYDPEIAAVPDEKKIAIAREVERIAMAQDKRITNSEGGSFSNTEREAGLFNSKGISYVLKETSCGFSTYVIAGEGDNMQGGGWSSYKRFFKELAPVEDVAKRAAQRAVEMLGAKPVETKKVPGHLRPLCHFGLLDGNPVRPRRGCGFPEDDLHDRNARQADRLAAHHHRRRPDQAPVCGLGSV